VNFVRVGSKKPEAGIFIGLLLGRFEAHGLKQAIQSCRSGAVKLIEVADSTV